MRCSDLKRAAIAAAATAAATAAAFLACAPNRSPANEQLEPEATVALRVVSYNIKHGRGNDDRVDLERTAAVLRSLQPDVVGLQEVDDGVERSGRVDEARMLGEALDLNHAFGSFFDYQGGRYGMAVLTRYPIRRVTPVQLPRGNEPRIALAVEVDAPGFGVFTIVNVHFDWVRDDGFRFAQASTLTAYLDTLATPYILLGDFNDVRESRTLALFFARADEAVKPADDRLTFSSTNPEREIDFIFTAPRGQWSAGGVRVVDERLASDHRPVVGVLRRREDEKTRRREDERTRDEQDHVLDAALRSLKAEIGKNSADIVLLVLGDQVDSATTARLVDVAGAHRLAVPTERECAITMQCSGIPPATRIVRVG